MTGRELQDHWVETLARRYGNREAGQIFRLWLFERYGWNALQWHDVKEQSLSDVSFEEDLNRLAAGEPIQYILGIAEFSGLRLRVTRDVLIPRPETEDLVRHVVDLAPPAARILDVGTGSGCIAMAVAALRPDVRVTGMDISEVALQISGENATNLGINVQWFRGDALNDKYPSGPWDVIVSNPPYIPQSEESSLKEHVLRHEPTKALFVSDENPLQFYDAIGRKAGEITAPGALVCFETHAEYATEVARLMHNLEFECIDIVDDYTGRPRICTARVPK